jgi:hypothetical protein
MAGVPFAEKTQDHAAGPGAARRARTSVPAAGACFIKYLQ